MITAFKFRLKPSKKQKTEFKRLLAAHSELYNFALTQKEAQYKAAGKSDTCFDQIKALIPALREREDFAGTNYSSLQQTIRKLHKNYALFYKKITKKPRHKAMKSITFGKHGDGWKVKGDVLRIQGLGEIPMRVHREIKGKITSATVKLNDDKLYVSIAVDQTPEFNSGQIKAIGLDYGLKSFLTTSEGETIEHPRPLQKNRKRLAKINRQIHRDGIAAAVKDKKKKARRKIYEKIANQRRDFAHKLSRKLIREYSCIAVEDLDLDKLVARHMNPSQSRNINNKARDLGVAQFYKFLSYKAESAGRQLIKVNPANTTRTCCACGKTQILTLQDRQYSCECGNDIDRDVNAAKNILKAALDSAVGLYGLAHAPRSPQL